MNFFIFSMCICVYLLPTYLEFLYYTKYTTSMCVYYLCASYLKIQGGVVEGTRSWKLTLCTGNPTWVLYKSI